MSEIINETGMGMEDTAPETESTGAMEDDWDDIDLSDVFDDASERPAPAEEPQEEPNPEADQQKEEETGEEQQEQPTKEEGEEQKEEEADQQTFDLKYLGQTRTVGKEEVITLAQKGLNYDKVLGERDTLRSEQAKLKGYEDFLKEIASPGQSIEDLIDNTRAEVIMRKEGVDKQTALGRVKLERDIKAHQEQKSKETAEKQTADAAKQRQQDNFLRFSKEYPDVDAKSIPKDVWMAFHNGEDLVYAYTRHETKVLQSKLKDLESALEAEKQNNKNKERSTGSQQSAGAESHKKTDPIDDDWYSGT